MKSFRFRQKLFLGFDMIRIIDARIYGADGNALLIVMKSNALGALVGDDVVVLIGKSRMHLAVQFVFLTPGINRLVGALGFASATIDAFLVNKQSHGIKSSTFGFFILSPLRHSAGDARFRPAHRTDEYRSQSTLRIRTII
jgi:hypothetical protein